MDKLYESYKIAADNAYKIYQLNPNQDTWEEYCKQETLAATYYYEKGDEECEELSQLSL